MLVYETEPLADDLTIAGPIDGDLHVSTTGTDSDWVVKLIDVFPDNAPDPQPNPANVRMGGYQMLLAGDILRGEVQGEPVATRADGARARSRASSSSSAIGTTRSSRATG